MRTVRWTDQALEDLAAIREFIGQDSPNYASIVVARLLRAVERLSDFPESGRVVPEFERRSVREVVERPYRIFYRLVGEREIHILTVHHGANRPPEIV